MKAPLKIYLSRSRASNKQLYEDTKAVLVNKGALIVEYTSGPYSHKPMLDCDLVVFVPANSSLGSPTSFMVGKGQHDQLQQLVWAGWSISRKTFVVRHSMEEDVHTNINVVGNPITSYETMELDWTSQYGKFRTRDNFLLSTNLIGMECHAKDLPEEKKRSLSDELHSKLFDFDSAKVNAPKYVDPRPKPDFSAKGLIDCSPIDWYTTMKSSDYTTEEIKELAKQRTDWLNSTSLPINSRTINPVYVGQFVNPLGDFTIRQQGYIPDTFQSKVKAEEPKPMLAAAVMLGLITL